VTQKEYARIFYERGINDTQCGISDFEDAFVDYSEVGIEQNKSKKNPTTIDHERQLIKAKELLIHYLYADPKPTDTECVEAALDIIQKCRYQASTLDTQMNAVLDAMKTHCTSAQMWVYRPEYGFVRVRAAKCFCGGPGWSIFVPENAEMCTYVSGLYNADGSVRIFTPHSDAPGPSGIPGDMGLGGRDDAS